MKMLLGEAGKLEESNVVDLVDVEEKVIDEENDMDVEVCDGPQFPYRQKQ